MTDFEAGTIVEVIETPDGLSGANHVGQIGTVYHDPEYDDDEDYGIKWCWVKFPDGQEKDIFTNELRPIPVTEEEVQAAIQSILRSVG